MGPHRFAVGQTVTYAQTLFPNLISGADCVIMDLLPGRACRPEYLVGCAALAGQVIVAEEELRRSGPERPADGRAPRRSRAGAARLPRGVRGDVR